MVNSYPPTHTHTHQNTIGIDATTQPAGVLSYTSAQCDSEQCAVRQHLTRCGNVVLEWNLAGSGSPSPVGSHRTSLAEQSTELLASKLGRDCGQPWFQPLARHSQSFQPLAQPKLSQSSAKAQPKKLNMTSCLDHVFKGQPEGRWSATDRRRAPSFCQCPEEAG